MTYDWDRLPESKAETILVVDDDAGFRDMISFTIENLGYAVTTAADGHKALEAVKEQRPDLMILDLMMPGMSGYEVLRELRRSGGEAPPVIVVSAALDADINGLNAAAYLAKPFVSSQLVWLVESVLDYLRRARSPVERVAA